MIWLEEGNILQIESIIKLEIQQFGRITNSDKRITVIEEIEEKIAV